MLVALASQPVTETAGRSPAGAALLQMRLGVMSLFSKDGAPKLVPECTYPLTGLACVSRVYTEHATFLVSADGVTVVETFGTTVDDLAERLRLDLPRLED